jgi:hypothetical protein
VRAVNRHRRTNSGDLGKIRNESALKMINGA